jgi:hypothetical protein
MDKLGVLKFFEEGTLSVEAETGMAVNESSNRATSMAIQSAVVELIREGERKGHWEYDAESVEQIKQAREAAKFVNKVKRTVKKYTQSNQTNQTIGETNE